MSGWVNNEWINEYGVIVSLAEEEEEEVLGQIVAIEAN